MTRYPGTQAVERALRILKAFSPERRSWSLNPLAAAVGLNKTTTHRLLKALEAEGFLARPSGSAEYVLGPESIALGWRGIRATGLSDVAVEELRALATDLGETATLEVLVGRETLIIREAPGGHVLNAAVELGTRWPAHATATGKVLLAAVPAERLDLAERLPSRTPRTIVDPARLREELEEVQAQGYAVNIEELEVGFAAIAAPVRDGGEHVVAAIGIGGPRARLTDSRIPEVIERVRQAGRRVSRRLGSPEAE